MFLHKIEDGAIDKSYGIHVADLAGLPKDIINDANKMLKEYETNSKDSGSKQISFDFTEPVKEPNILKEEIDKIDPLNTTPMDALKILFDLKNKSKDIRE